jgi:hypothetical protein
MLIVLLGQLLLLSVFDERADVSEIADLSFADCRLQWREIT